MPVEPKAESMNYLQRLCALIPEASPEIVGKALHLLRIGIPAGEVQTCLGLSKDYAALATDILRVSMFLVTHRMEPVAVPQPLQVERTNEAYTIKLNGKHLEVSADDALYLLSELYARRGEIIELTHLIT